MFRLIWIISIYVRSFMRRFMPSNVALAALQSRRGLKWGMPAMLLSILYFYLAALMSDLIDGGASKWLYVVTIICIWNAFKFLVHGPASLIQLARVRAIENLRRHDSTRRPTGSSTPDCS